MLNKCLEKITVVSGSRRKATMTGARKLLIPVMMTASDAVKRYEGWNFNFGNTPLDWIQELLE